MYHYGMLIKLLTLALVSVGCAQPPVEPIVIKSSTCARVPTVAVIDTGFTFSPHTVGAKLCRFGHKDFTTFGQTIKPSGFNDPVPVDNHGHGTNVAGVIQANAGDAEFCIVIIKYYDPKAIANDNLKNTVKAIKYATNIGVKYINYSGGGTDMSVEERDAVKAFLDKGGQFIAAAGNEKADLSIQPYYPAMDDKRIVVVGSKEKDGSVSRYSNHGKQVTQWEYGSGVVGFGILMSGTSQAAAIATGKIIKQSKCDK
jgi:hypothetical protein